MRDPEPFEYAFSDGIPIGVPIQLVLAGKEIARLKTELKALQEKYDKAVEEQRKART